ncbi:Lectin C domain containing protein [Trichuris trichiura]|uniref:Lectin C domain containing protein n=1 Tax=Trichuris trichiura TaxID=36087 RepID=A0A077Z0K5_TRITR|nr:Lectin C domain containing protein [Trichuris trichiura]
MVVISLLLFALSALFQLGTSETPLYMCKDPGWFLHGSRCYRMFYNRKNHANAQNFCKEKGSDLFLPSSVENLHNVTDQMPFMGNAWINLRNEDSNSTNDTITVTVKSLPFRSRGAKARGKKSVKCAAVFRQGEMNRSVQWSPCINPRPFICEKDSLELKPPVVDYVSVNDTAI